MTKEEIAWAVQTLKLGRKLRPNADVFLLIRDFTPLEVDLKFDDVQQLVEAAKLPNVYGGDSNG